MSINKPYVFISYRSTEETFAYETKNILKKNGIESWMAPESIPAGSDYGSEIPPAIKGCFAFVLLLSKQAQESKWIPKEMDGAINNGKIIIPFQIDDSNLIDSFDFRLSDSQRIKAYQRMSEAYGELVQRLKELIPVNNGLISDDENNSFRERRIKHFEINRQRIEGFYALIKDLSIEKGIEYIEDGGKYIVYNGMKMKLVVYPQCEISDTARIRLQINICGEDGICFVCLGKKCDENYKKIEYFNKITNRHSLDNKKIVKWYLIEDFITELFGEEALEKL